MKKPTRFVVLDTETGGFDPATDSILSLGGVVIADGVIQEQGFYLLVNEGEHYHANEGAIAVNGITLEQTQADGLSPAQVVRFLHNWLGKWGLTWGVVIIGANTNFDVGFIKRLYRLAGVPYDKRFSHRTMDVQSIAGFLEQANLFDLGGDSASLDNLCRRLKVEIDRTTVHNSMEDARATAHVYQKLLALTGK